MLLLLLRHLNALGPKCTLSKRKCVSKQAALEEQDIIDLSQLRSQEAAAEPQEPRTETDEEELDFDNKEIGHTEEELESIVDVWTDDEGPRPTLRQRKVMKKLTDVIENNNFKQKRISDLAIHGLYRIRALRIVREKIYA